MALVGSRLFVALDARAVTAAAVRARFGEQRLDGFARVPLAPGVLLPSPSATDLVGRDELRAAVRRALDGVAHASGRVTLVLPDGLARLALVAPPPGVDARDFVRFRLAGSLPWEASETMVEVLSLGRGRAVGAALRRGAITLYEHALRSAGFEVERVHLAPLLALESLARTGPREAVHVVLGDAAACLVAVREGAIAALRSRRRDPSTGESARLFEEAARTARLAGDGHGPPRVVFSGSDARRLRDELGRSDVASDGGAGERPEAAEAAWLRSVLS